MTTCTDVFVRPQTCDTISIYPLQVHPFVPPPTPGGGPAGGRYEYDFMGEGPVKKKKHDDDEALALILIEWIRNAE